MKYFRLILIFVIVLGGFGLYHQTANAGAFTYNSSINLQNLVNATANITLHFYNPDGTENVSPVSDTIAPLGSKQYFPIPATNGFNGSVVIESDAQIASISNILGNNGAAAASYIGSSSGGAPVLLPLLMWENSGYNTWFNVQNAGAVDANVSVAYSDGATATAVIKAGAAHTFDQTTETHTLHVFSAVVSSDQPIAATVIEENTKVMFAYSGFIGTSVEPVMPLINAYNAGYVTGATIQNSGDVTTTVTVDYTATTGGGTSCHETQTIPAGQNKTFALLAFAGVPGIDTDCVPLTKFVGSGKVTANSASQPLTVIVNQLKGSINGEAYSGFNPADATGKVILPLIMNANGGYWTSINLMNVGDAQTVVTCTFTPFEGAPNPTPSATLAPGAGVSFLQAAGDEFGSTKYVGSATCTGDNNGKIIAVVNEVGPSSTADQLLVYEGFNIAP